MIPRFFRRLAEGVFDIEDLKLRTNELADFVEKASLQPMGLMQEMSWRLVTQMMPILLQAFSCSALRRCPVSYSSELWFLLFQTGCSTCLASGYSCHQGCKILLPQKTKLKPSLTCSGKLKLT
jgi:hypothetical protein